MYDITKIILQKQFDKLVNILPTLRQKRLGRKRCQKGALLNGILQVLVLGIGWNKIFDCGCLGSSYYRYFKELQRRGLLKLIYESSAKEKTDIIEGAIDTTTVTSFRFKSEIGWDGKHKKIGTKVSLFTDKNGLPAHVDLGKGNEHDGSFVSEHLKKTFRRRKKLLNLDNIYVGLDFRREMRKKGTYVNMKTRKGDYIRKRGPKFKFDEEKYKVRFLVERTNAWLKNFWRIRIRREYHIAMFKAFIYLAFIIILIRS